MHDVCAALPCRALIDSSQTHSGVCSSRCFSSSLITPFSKLNGLEHHGIQICTCKTVQYCGSHIIPWQLAVEQSCRMLSAMPLGVVVMKHNVIQKAVHRSCHAISEVALTKDNCDMHNDSVKVGASSYKPHLGRSQHRLVQTSKSNSSTNSSCPSMRIVFVVSTFITAGRSSCSVISFKSLCLHKDPV